MNIFDKFLDEIKILILSNQKKLGIDETNEFKGITAENPPDEFDFDLSSNVCLILAKINKMNPTDLAEKIKNLLLENLQNISTIEIAGPGFLNIKFTSDSIRSFISSIFSNKERYGSTSSNKKYNIEFVSANPTGPMHVGHCRGAIYGLSLIHI